MSEDSGMLLAIDTIGRRVGIAIWSDGAILHEEVWQANRDHTTRLIPAIESAFRECGVSRKDIENLAVCTGPGSFSAARAGVAVAKTLGFVWGLPVYGGNCFEVSAHMTRKLVADVLVAAPMGRGRWATQILNCDGKAAVAIAEPEVVDQAGLAAFAGRYSAIVSDDTDLGGEMDLSGELHVRAPTWLAEWAVAQIAAGKSGSVDELEPYYLQGARITLSKRKSFGKT